MKYKAIIYSQLFQTKINFNMLNMLIIHEIRSVCALKNICKYILWRYSTISQGKKEKNIFFLYILLLIVWSALLYTLIIVLAYRVYHKQIIASIFTREVLNIYPNLWQIPMLNTRSYFTNCVVTYSLTLMHIATKLICYCCLIH